MANAVGLNYSNLFKSIGQTSKRTTGTGKNSVNDLKNSSAQYAGNFSVELSESGLNALANQKNSVDDAADKNGALKFDEGKLSAKAQDYLEKLRDKYDNYDFIVADNVDDPQSFSQQSAKGYSVILSTEELEKMADDERYAAKVMGQVDKAVGVIDELSETALEDGVEFSSLAVSIDDQGNMKLFAGLEKMSEEQRDRLEKLKEKRAEEKQEAAKKADEESDEDKEEETFSVKSTQIEADSPEELLDKIFSIDWNEIAEENFYF